MCSPGWYSNQLLFILLSGESDHSLHLSTETKKLLEYWLFSHFWSIFFCFRLLMMIDWYFHGFCNVISEDYLNRKLSNGSELLKYAGTPLFCCILSFLQNDELVSCLASIHVFCLNQIHPSNHGWLKAIPTTYINYCKSWMHSLLPSALLFHQIPDYYQNVIPFILE